MGCQRWKHWPVSFVRPVGDQPKKAVSVLYHVNTGQGRRLALFYRTRACDVAQYLLMRLTSNKVSCYPCKISTAATFHAIRFVSPVLYQKAADQRWLF